ncbi:hypothetical protein PENSPDRAFT_690898 [Peniophora sp. CONT]|nr:hypothetical protein PENSPDRAFT_690898 [Peniophora sp. CONT]
MHLFALARLARLVSARVKVRIWKFVSWLFTILLRPSAPQTSRLVDGKTGDGDVRPTATTSVIRASVIPTGASNSAGVLDDGYREEWSSGIRSLVTPTGNRFIYNNGGVLTAPPVEADGQASAPTVPAINTLPHSTRMPIRSAGQHICYDTIFCKVFKPRLVELAARSRQIDYALIMGQPSFVATPPTDDNDPDSLHLCIPTSCNKWNIVFEELNPEQALRFNVYSSLAGGYSKYKIPPLKTRGFSHAFSTALYSEQSTTIELGDWIQMVHPDGTLYFYSPSSRAYTEVYLHDIDMLQHVNNLVNYLDITIGELDVKLPAPEEQLKWSYYMVDHKARSLFWLREYDIDRAIFDELGFSSPDHAKLRLESWYWLHRALYPRQTNLPPFPVDARERLTGMLTFCAADARLKPNMYTAPLTVEDMIQLVEHLKLMEDDSKNVSVYFHVVAAKTLHCMIKWTCDSFHGQPFVRRHRGSPIRLPPKPTWLLTTLAAILFYAPLSQLQDINAVFADGVFVNTPEWNKHIAKLLAEWEDFVLYATVILTVNVSFLAVPNVMLSPGGQTGGAYNPTSAAAIISYTSMLASVGSIIIGLLLVRQHRGEQHADSFRSLRAKFLRARSSVHFGFEPLAIIYSLPYALLMWSVAAFLAAFTVFTMSNTGVPTRATVSLVLLVLAFLVIWCISEGWTTSPGREVFSRAWAEPSRLVSVVNMFKTNVRSAHRLKAYKLHTRREATVGLDAERL